MLDNVLEVLTVIQTRTIKPIPVVLVGESYWRQAVNLNFLVDEGVIDQEDRELFWYAETAEEIWNGILHGAISAASPCRLHERRIIA
jgi:predicted Rossmann-fold nucleotide-binding protein